MQNTNEQLELLGRIDRARILVAGDVMLDRYWSGNASRLSPEAPVPVVALDKVSNIPGGAANVAANIAALGTQVILAGACGSDESGNALRDALRQQGISDSHLVACGSRQTTTKTRVLVHNQQIARIDDETVKPLSGSDESALCEKITEALAAADAVVVSDYAKGCLTPAVLAAAIGEARKKGIPVIVDPKARDLKRYNGASLLTPNLAEALNAAGIEKGTEEQAGEAARIILGSSDIDGLLITLGEHGMKLFRRGVPDVHFPSMARQVFDVTGAGDTVVALLAAGLAADASLESAISLANLAAGIAVEKLGTSVVRVEELRTAIHDLELHLSMEQ